MIPPLDYYWSQLDGPQATAYMQGIYKYFFDTLDPVLTGIGYSSIDDLDKLYLSTVGAILGIGRPPVTVRDKDAVVFTDLRENPETGIKEALKYTKDANRGYVDLNDPTYGGGQFVDLGNPVEQQQSLSNAAYRAILKTVANSKGSKGSLVLLDDLISKICQLGSGATSPQYTITILKENDPVFTQYLKGDVIVDIGRANAYIDPYLVEGTIKSMLNTQFGGLPKIWLKIAPN